MKTVLITGASRGLGKDLALKFALNGAALILSARTAPMLKVVAKWMDGLGAQVHEETTVEAIAGDLRDPETIRALYAAAEKTGLDILINCAGVLYPGTIRETHIGEILETIETNLLAPIELTKKLYPIFLKQSAGLIININSLAGKNPNGNEAAYCASKYGLRGFFDSFKFEAIKHNIHILNIYPGAMNTDMAKERKDRKKLIDPAEAAGIIYQLCADYETARIPEIEIWRRNY